MKKAGTILALLLLLIIGAAAGLGVGYYLGYDTGKHSTQTFYGSIDDIRSNSLCVIGLEENDINHRGAFRFSVKDVPMSWRSTEIAWKDLQIGDVVAVTYAGPVQETAPAGIGNVVKLELLSDRERGWSLAVQCKMWDSIYTYSGEIVDELPSGAVEFGSVPKDYEGNCEGTLYGTPGDVVYFQYAHESEYAVQMPYFVLYPDIQSE